MTTPKKATKTTAKKTAANLRLVPGEDTGTAFEQVHRTGEDERRPGEYEQVPLDFDDEGRGSHD